VAAAVVLQIVDQIQDLVEQVDQVVVEQVEMVLIVQQDQEHVE
tara:strand:- start:142 stop:270 length:129 start_codon:yes stop_codon:yes gene_type:complete